MLYEYKCDKCGEVVEDLRSMADRELLAPCAKDKCDGTLHFIISTPQIRLEGITGHFPGAYDKWAKVREQRIKVERKRSYNE